MAPRRALVTGAGGCGGRAVVHHLVKNGWSVNALDMNPAALEPLRSADPADSVRLFRGSLSDSQFLHEAAKDVEAVFHAAAKVHAIPRSPKEEAEFFEVNVTGTENLLRACATPGLAAFVFFSTIAVYGTGDGNPLSEASPLNPENAYARSKAEAEQRVREFGFPGGARATIFRMSLVYGEGERGNFSRMIRAIDAGRFVFIGDGSTRKSTIYVGDVARAALLAAELRQAQGETFVLSDPEPYTVREISATIARHLGVRAPRWRVPPSLLRAGGRVLRAAGTTLGFRPIFTDEDVGKLMTDSICDTSRIRARLGFEPHFGLEEGVRRTIEWTRRKERA
jgi:nucleoside-diphosphate-sugar epimerase